MGKFKDLTGNKYGLLTVLSVVNKGKTTRWKCKCDCGNDNHITSSNSIRKGVRSCGCITRQALIDSKVTHGHYIKNRRLYHIWELVMRRCYNPKDASYQNYGGRGISVFDQWHEASSFIEWSLDNGYAKELTIDRVNNDLSYCPLNCRWIKFIDNQQNRSNTLGVEKVLKIRNLLSEGITNKELSLMFGVSTSTISGIKTRRYYYNIP